MMELTPAAFGDLYRTAKLVSKRKNGTVPYSAPDGNIIVLDLEAVLRDLDWAVELAETCKCCGKRSE